MNIHIVGIKKKLLVSFSVLFITIFVIVLAVGVQSIKASHQSSLNAGNSILIEQGKSYYRNYTVSQKRMLELLLETIEHDVTNLQQFAQDTFNNAHIIDTRSYWDPAKHLTKLPNNQLKELGTDNSTLWSPDWMIVNDEVLKRIEISAFLDNYFEPLLVRNENTVANYFLGKEGYLRYYPRINMHEKFPPDFDTTKDIYFKPATPAENPSRELVWTPLYVDPAGQGLMVSAIAPVYSASDEFLGVVGTDLTLKRLVANYIAENNETSSYAILLDKDMKPIALPPSAIRDIYGLVDESDIQLTESLLNVDSGFKAVLESVRHLRDGFKRVELNDRTVYVSFVRLGHLQWFYANVLAEEQILSATEPLRKSITGSSIAAFVLPTVFCLLVVLVLMSRIIGRAVEPIVQMLIATRTVSNGGQPCTVNCEQTDDEIGELVTGFNQMACSLAEHHEHLEVKVRERTNELAEKNALLTETIESLNSARRQLVEKEKMASLGGLVAGIAHELNTPIGIVLTAITSFEREFGVFKGLYSDKKLTAKKLEHFIAKGDEAVLLVLNSINRTEQLISSFKLVSVDQNVDEKRTFNFYEYMDKTLITFRPTLKKLDVEIDFNCDKNVVINSYPAQFYSIFANLVNNSRIHGFSGAGSNQWRITITVQTTNSSMLIEYEDNGQGIDEEVKPKIFDPFFTTNRGPDGTGLGLHLVYNIVTQRLNGSLECDSRKGHGAKFTIEFPIIG